ncbi:MAG: GrpB family protein [Bacteroidales bacterium]|nr:GrpB family protein [Bacteroidales bacterium]
MHIIIENYNPLWKELFKAESDRIYKAIGFVTPCIEHIGSTSIDNLLAKPIIDILIGLPKKEQLDDLINPITSLGYTYVRKFEQVTQNRRFFVFFDGFKLKLIDFNDDFPYYDQNRKFHVHAFEMNSYDWIRHIALRDYLRFHDSEKNTYKNFKITLSKRDFKDTLDYSEAKNNFLKELEDKAICWYNENNNIN